MNIQIHLFLCFFIFAIFPVVAAATNDESRLLDLPTTAFLEFNQPYVVTSAASRSGTGEQALIVTTSIDLLGMSAEAKESRLTNAAIIDRLRELKSFDSLESIWCFVDFNAEIWNDIEIPAGSKLMMATPEQYGTPSEKYTVHGDRITLENRGRKSLSGSFEGAIGRRLYCQFNTNFFNPKEGLLDDLKIIHLKLLLESHFKLLY